MKKIKYLASAAILAACAGATFISGSTYADPIQAGLPQDEDAIAIERTITDIPSHIEQIDDVTFTYTAQVVEYPEGVTSSAIMAQPASPQTCAFVAEVEGGIATKSCSIDLSALRIDGTKVGIYKIRITETASSKASDYPVASQYFDVAVIVRRNKLVNGVWTESPSIEIISEAGNNSDVIKEHEGQTETKVDGIEFSAPMIEHTYIQLKKEVAGVFANLGESFEFNILVEDPNDANNTSTYHIGNTSCTIGTLCSAAVTLTNGNSANIGISSSNLNELVPGMTYTITETGAEDYTTSIQNFVVASGNTATLTTTNNSKTISGAVLSASVTASDFQNLVTFTNTRDDSILNSLTGVFFNILPYIMLAGASIFGVILVKKSKQ